MNRFTISRLKGAVPKQYIKSLTSYSFDSFSDLLLLLFSTYEKGTRDWDEIKSLLDHFGYDNISQISKDELSAVRKWIKKHNTSSELDNDIEYISYKLLSAIVNKDVIVYIDEEILEKIEAPIEVSEDSIISFIDTVKANQITFTTL